MPHSVASDLGLNSLPMSHKKDARLIWVKKRLLLKERACSQSKKDSKDQESIQPSTTPVQGYQMVK